MCSAMLESKRSESLAERLRRLRHEHGLSQRDVAGPGVSPAYVSRIESGERRPSVRALRVIARKLGVSLEYLETGSAISAGEERELRLAEAELRLRLGEDLQGAEQALTQLHTEAREAGDLDQAARALVGLGLAAAHTGRHGEAVTQLEQCLESSLVSPLSHPNVFVTLGLSYMALGQPEQAVALFARCLDEIDAHVPDDLAARVRFATHLSYALSNLGELERARELLVGLSEAVEGAVDPYARIRLYWSLARLAVMAGQPAVALRQLRRAIGLLESTEDTLQLARAHLLCSEILIFAGQAERAGQHLELAGRLFELGGESRDLGAVRTQQAKRALALGHADEALERAREALGFLGEHLEQGSAWHALGLAQALQGERDEATESLRQAVDHLTRNGEWREASEACRARAKVLRELGREAEAFAALERAVELSARIAERGRSGRPRVRAE